MKPIKHAIMLLAPLAIAACSSQPADEGADAGIAQSAGQAASDVAVTPAQTVAADASVPAAIPAAIQGRWGLVPADCTSTRGDAKGLMIIAPAKITFYESVAKLGAVQDGGENRIRATFAFTGEGMEWTRDMLLEVAPGDRSLARQEFGNDAAPGPLVYTRCV